MTEVAIVGAGVAGAGATYALRDAATVTIFEKTEMYGRTATRRKHGCRYDYGANYFKDEDSGVTELVTETLDTDGLVEIDLPVWTFNSDDGINEGHDTDERKWTYRTGIDQLTKRLFSRTDTTVETGTRVETVERENGSWRLESGQKGDLGSYDVLLLTPPAPQTATLLAATEWDAPLKTDLEAAIRTVPFRTTITVILHYPFELDRPYYALVNTDREHDIGWLAREECKPSHVPDGESLLIAQMGSQWSNARYSESVEAVAGEVADLTADLLDDDRLTAPDWTDSYGWRLAQPEGTVEDECLERAANHGLFFAGDWVAGEGRVHLALRNGLDTGERIVEQLEA